MVLASSTMRRCSLKVGFVAVAGLRSISVIIGMCFRDANYKFHTQKLDSDRNFRDGGLPSYVTS
jgi:hypothetical protein